MQLGYRFTARTHIFASAGKDENTYTAVGNQNIDESSWHLGLDWQPGSRDFISLQYGERFFGHTGSFSWRHNARRLNVNANYQEELSTSALSLLQSQQLASSNPEQTQQVTTNSSITSQVFVRELTNIGLTYTISKTTLSGQISNETRKFQESGDISLVGQ